MSLPDGYGSIYCSSWWGDWDNTKSIPFESRPDCFKYIPPVPDYILRVEAAGGVVEGKQCLSDAIERLKGI